MECCTPCDTNAPFQLQRDTVWNVMSVQFPYALSDFSEIRIDFKDTTTGTIVKGISSTDVDPASRIEVNLETNTIYPILTAEDTLTFSSTVLYAFDVALIAGGQVTRRLPVWYLVALETITTEA